MKLADPLPTPPIPAQPDEPRRAHSMYGFGAFILALLALAVDFVVWRLGGTHSEVYRQSNMGAWTDKPWILSIALSGYSIKLGLRSVGDRERRPVFRWLGIVFGVMAVAASVRLLDG